MGRTNITIMFLRSGNDDGLPVGLEKSGRHLLERVRFILGLHIGLFSGNPYDPVLEMRQQLTLRWSKQTR